VILHVRYDGGVAILSNLGRAMNDPRYVDAAREVEGLLDEGCREFVLEMREVREAGAPLLGVLMTLTRRIRGDRGEIVLAGVPKAMARYLAEMQMEEYWDRFQTVDEAKASFSRGASLGEGP
jgi:anti-sigma B factor antagonist